MSFGVSGSAGSALGAPSGALRTGNLAGWALLFYREKDGSIDRGSRFILNSDRYDARSIEAVLPERLVGGSYTFVLEGVTDEDYERIRQSGTDSPPVVELYLWWRDVSGVKGYLANVTGLTSLARPDEPPREACVAVLQIVNVARERGERRYETIITARERVFHCLNRSLTDTLKAKSLKLALEQVKKATGVAVQLYEIPSQTGEERSYGDKGTTYRRVFEEAARSLEQQLPEKQGRGMLLIRNDTLHVGPRPIPLEGKKPKELTPSTGFVEAVRLAPEPDPEEGPKPPPPPGKRQFKVTLKGRADIKPGDLVQFDPPPGEDVPTTPSFGKAIFGGLGAAVGDKLLPSLSDKLGDHPVTLYVKSVKHRLGRTVGFRTEVTGVEIANPEQPWEKAGDDAPSDATRRGPTSSAAADGATAAAAAITARAADEARTRRFPEVAEVRRFNPSGIDEPPAQTATLWRGLVAPDGGASSARRLAIRRRDPAPLPGVAYLSPFAWGKCGLILPRYPGTRVLLAHRNGDPADAVDLGALWESGTAPDSQPGDWWLILPVGVPADRRQALPDATDPPEAHTGKATNDLIDADGNRVITVGELTVRVGQDGLTDAGTRPERTTDAGSVTLEHVGGAKIVMKQDGTVVITAKQVEITSQRNIALKATGDVTIEARKVDVKVSDKMDVHA